MTLLFYTVKDQSKILFYFREDVDKRIEIIQEQIKITESTYDREKLEERLAKLRGGVGVIKVGGGS